MEVKQSPGCHHYVYGMGNLLQILEIAGKLTDGTQSDLCYAELQRQVKEGARLVVLDLKEVPDIDSTGIGFLVMCLTTVQRAGGELRLAAPSGKVLSALLMTKLDSIFRIFPSVQSAATPKVLSGLPGSHLAG